MSLHSDARPLAIERLGANDLIETFEFLDRDPVVNVYLLALTVRDALSQPRDEFWGVRREGELVGVLYIGGSSGAVLPCGDDRATCAQFARHVVARRSFLPRRFQVIGPWAPVNAIVDALEQETVRPRLRRSQWYMSVARGGLAPFAPLPELRQARPGDYELTYRTGAMLRAEELEEDPRVTDPLAYAKRVDEECRDGYTFLWTDAQGLCFRASVSARTPDAAQVSGVYVPPERRGQGFAKRGMGELCSRLLAESRSVCLFVNDFNAPAIAVYRRLGFADCAEWASAFYDSRR